MTVRMHGISPVLSDSPKSTFIVYLLPLYRTRQTDGRAACSPNSLTRTVEPLFRCFNRLSLVIIQERRSPFPSWHHHTWGLRGASRGRDKFPLV